MSIKDEIKEEDKWNNNTANIHVYKDSKNAPKTFTPPRDIFTSTSQKKKYITIAGIESDTSYLEYQWPEFAVKELNDNADDFFKVYYPNATANERRISTKVIVDTITKRPVNIIRIAVRNSNVNNYQVFPNLSGVFDYNSWGSTKRYQHKMTASALGDFLKRILGMGYASWMNINSNNNSPIEEDSFEDKQWDEPVILRFNGNKEYRFKKGHVHKFLSFEKARELARSLHCKHTDDYFELSRQRKLPEGLPTGAHRVYKDKWKGWNDFLVLHLHRYCWYNKKKEEYEEVKKKRENNSRINSDKTWHVRFGVYDIICIQLLSLLSS